MKFNIFGMLIGVSRTSGSWDAFYLGNEGKRRPADFIVPSDLLEDEVGEYLADLFHEHATPRNEKATRID